MATREFKGNAIVTALLAGGISSGDSSLTITAATNWPTGTGADQFVILIVSQDGSKREKILCESRSGTTITVASGGRNFDGTAASNFDTGDIVSHVADAAWMQLMDDHAFDTGRDDHTQYLDETRHADSALHTFGEALAEPGTPTDIATSPFAGTSDAPAHGDHRHQLGDGCIDNSGQFADGVVSSDAIADAAIVPGKIAASVAPGTLGIDIPFGVLRVKVDGTTCQLNVDGEIEVLGGVVSTGGIADNAITLSKMADDSVGSAEIIDANVLTAHLIDAIITTIKIADAAVTKAKLDPAIGRGLQNFATKTTSQTGITTEATVTGLSVTSQPETATRYRRVHFRARNIESSVPGDNVLVTFKRGAVAIGSMYVEAASGGCDIWCEDDDAPIAAHVYTVTVQRTSGTGSVQVDGTAAGPAILEVWDMGGH